MTDLTPTDLVWYGLGALTAWALVVYVTPLTINVALNFKIQDSNLDSWIGRTAHIQFLENQQFIKMLIYRYRDCFA